MSITPQPYQHIQTIGILGGGQLGMMLAESAMQLGYTCIFLEDSPNCPASRYGKVYSTQQLDDFAKHADVFTLSLKTRLLKRANGLPRSRKTLIAVLSIIILLIAMMEKNWHVSAPAISEVAQIA